MMKKSSGSGFTIVELLIVIVIVAILSGIVIMTFKGIQDQARAVSIADGLRKIDRAMKAYIIAEGTVAWWDDATLVDANGESTLDHIIATTNFKQYMNKSPEVSGLDNIVWTYDNDGDTYNGCTVYSTGVNIEIEAGSSDIAMRVDKILDDGNLSCGNVRYDSQTDLVYLLSKNSVVDQ